MGSRTYSYYVLGYFGSCHYCFVFSDFDISAEQIHNTLGHLIIQIEEIPWVSNLPGNGVNDWTMIQCKDALIGEGGSDVTRRMEGLGGTRAAQPCHKLASYATLEGRACPTGAGSSLATDNRTQRICNKRKENR